MTANGVKAGLDGRNGEAFEGSLRIWASFFCGSGGVECIFFGGLQKGLAERRRGSRTDSFWE